MCEALSDLQARVSLLLDACLFVHVLNSCLHPLHLYCACIFEVKHALAARCEALPLVRELEIDPPISVRGP